VNKLRCLTLNLWGAEAPLEARMRLVEDGLRSLAPDVIALQEVRSIPGRLPNQAETLARALGYDMTFGSAARPGAHEDWGLALLSKRAIVDRAAMDLPEAEESERRILLSAQVESDLGPVWVHTTHLNYRLQDGEQREEQVMAIDVALGGHGGDRPQILMGDFNARPESDEIRWLRGLTTLNGRRTCFQDSWDRVNTGQPGWTWASANRQTAPLHFLELDRRIDYIFVTPERRDGRGRVHDCRLAFEQPDAQGVFASDHFGLYADIQL
jgi:endonuclease/exonuclease/phosphatase family metal-dependent hydrolase